MIDHKTCGHVDHITLDGSRHEEMHTAVCGLIQKWTSEANSLDKGGAALAFIKRACVRDLVDAMHPFEVEQ
jgi:hypothetical protein